MKRFFIVLLVASSPFITQAASGQLLTPPAMEWQANLGGTGSEYWGALCESTTGGFFVGGTSYSSASGNKTGTNFGSAPDCWLVHLDSKGQKLWDKVYGGSQDDWLRSLVPTPDGGCILGGYSYSSMTGNKISTNYGGADYWVVRLDNNGAVLWDRSFGGSADDRLSTVIPTSDGGFLIGGASNSGADGTRSSPNFGTNGTADYWVVRLDSAGNQLWDKAYGGDSDDFLTCLRQTTDGGFILGGYSLSGMSGTKTSTNFNPEVLGSHSDYWVVRVDQNGDKLWDKSFGGSGRDRLFGIAQTSDEGYALGGWTLSENDGNKTAARINQQQQPDYWVVRLDADGNMLWDREFGAIDGDSELGGLEETEDGGFMLVGISAGSASGNKTSPLIGGNDLWLVRLDSDGNMLWDRSYGGTGFDGSPSAEPTASLSLTSDGGLIMGGSSQSGVGGNKSVPNYGVADLWVTKLSWSVHPLVQVASNSVVHQMTQCQHSVSNQSLRVWNGGSGLMAYTLTSNVPWITIKPANGMSAGETNTHTLTFNVAALPAGDYPASVEISPDAVASPYTVELLLNLLPPATPYNLLTVPNNPFPFQTRTRFICVLLGLPNRLYVIETTTNLIDWLPLQTNLATCAGVQITNSPLHQNSGFFYRARLL